MKAFPWQKGSPAHPSRSLLRIWLNASVALIASAVAILVLVQAVLPRLLEYQTYVVMSRSMQPAIPMGAVIVVVPEDPASLQVGDVISYALTAPGQDPVSITHRIHRILDENGRLSFETKGDANGAPDLAPITFEGSAGKVRAFVPYAGYFFMFGRSQEGRLLLVVLPALLFGVVWLWSIWRPRPSVEQNAVAEATGVGRTATSI